MMQDKIQGREMLYRIIHSFPVHKQKKKSILFFWFPKIVSRFLLHLLHNFLNLNQLKKFNNPSRIKDLQAFAVIYTFTSP